MRGHSNASTRVKAVYATIQPQLLPDLLAADPAASGATGAHSADALDAPLLVVAAAPAGSGGDAAGQQGQAPLLLYLRGRLACARGDASGGAALLEVAAARMVAECEGAPPGLEAFARLDAPRALEAARALVDAAGGEPRAPGEAAAPTLAKAARCARRTPARLDACRFATLSCCRCCSLLLVSHPLLSTPPPHLPHTRLLDALGRLTGKLPAAQLLHARALYLAGSLDAAARKVRWRGASARTSLRRDLT